MTTVEPRQGKVVFKTTAVGITMEDTMSREGAAAFMLHTAFAIVNSGDMCDPKAQNLLFAVATAVSEFAREE